MPQQGNSFVFVSDKLGEVFGQIQKQVLAKSKDMTSERSALVQKLIGGGQPSVSFSVGIVTENGWEVFGNGSQSFNRAALAPLVVAPIGLLAGIAIPNFVKARSTAQHNAMINNLRMLEGAKEQWALENRKNSGDAVSESDVAPYLPGKKLKPIAGEEYTINPVGTAPTAKIATAWNGHPAGTQISTADASVTRKSNVKKKPSP
jgi:type II secretory pathway pseudopilin PulG